MYLLSKIDVVVSLFIVSTIPIGLEWSGVGLELVSRVGLEWSGVGLALVWPWSGVGLALVWRWSGVGLALVWPWSGLGLAFDPNYHKQCLHTVLRTTTSRWSKYGTVLSVLTNSY